jgi:hypothetical protein
MKRQSVADVRCKSVSIVPMMGNVGRVQRVGFSTSVFAITFEAVVNNQVGTTVEIKSSSSE